MDRTLFNLVYAATKLFVPNRFDLGFVGIETRQKFFGKARAIFRRKSPCFGGQFRDEVRHAALQKPTTQVYADGPCTVVCLRDAPTGSPGGVLSAPACGKDV